MNDIADISDIRTIERTKEILHPGKKTPIGVRVTIVSINDPRLSKIKRDIQDRRAYLEARNKNFKADEIEDNRNRLAFGAMTGWEWYGLKYNGETPEFNRKNVFAVFEEYEWFRRQIEEDISEESDFFAS